MMTKLSKPTDSEETEAGLRVSERVAAILGERIRSGAYAVGDLLPTERTLAEELRVHRRSVRSAVDHLIEAGLVSRRPNCRPSVRRNDSSTEGRLPADLAVAKQRILPASTVGRQTVGRKARPPRISTSNLVALLMWHGGGPLEHAGSSQQRIFWGMNQALMKVGYHAVFLDIGGEQIGSEEENAAREAEHLRYVRDQGFGGALFYPYAYRHNRDLVQEVSREVPLVLLDRKIPGIDVDSVGIANREAMSEVTSHLLAAGHRRIAYVTNYEPIHPVQERIQGYLDAMRGTDSPDIMEMVLTLPPYEDDRRWTVADSVFRLPEAQRPTAVACVADYTAVSVAEHLEEIGLSTPGDLALTGFDNIVPALPNGTGLTTVAQPYEQIGSTAVELLMRRIRDRRAPVQSVELPANLIVRASSAP